MLLGVITEHADCLLEARLDQGQGSEGHRTTTSSLVLDRTDVALTYRVVGGGQVGHHGLLQHRLSFIVELLRILNVGGDEHVVRNIAELIDPLKPGPLPDQVGLVVHGVIYS